MEKVIELLESAYDLVSDFVLSHYGNRNDGQVKAEKFISQAIELLKTPRYLTPEQYKAETGKEWPDDAAVYVKYRDWEHNRWHPYWNISCYEYAKYRRDVKGQGCIIICAYCDNGPPPEGWVPE
jgi:hypothetical protein